MLAHFNPSEYYLIEHDYEIDAPCVELLPPALQLIVDYYSIKYSARIILCDDVNDFFSRYLKIISEASVSESKDIRVAFCVGTKATHCMPIIYIKENFECGWLASDSLGVMQKILNPRLRISGSNFNIARRIYSDLKIKSHITLEARQADLYSCRTDAIIFCCDAVEKDQQGNYVIPNLLSRLKSRSEEKDFYFKTRLPDELLKTVQISSYTEQHKESKEKFINWKSGKSETLSEFNKRYLLKREGKKTIPSYLRLKTIKFTSIIEIQFYMSICQQKFQINWDTMTRRQFVKNAKEFLNHQGNLFLNPTREGLYFFVMDFIEKNSNPSKLTNSHHVLFSLAQLKINQMAQSMIELVNDGKYWQRKTVFKISIPEGIAKMQAALIELGENISLEEKIHALRLIAKDYLSPTRGWLYLFTSFDANSKDKITNDFYKLFFENWLTSRKWPEIEEDWLSYKKSRQKESFSKKFSA